MIPRMLLAASVALGLTAAARAQQSSNLVYKLRQVAAVDAAQALAEFAARSNLALAVFAEPVSNAVLLSADPAPLQQATAMLAALDVRPPMLRMRMTLVRVPAEFAEEAGLGAEDKWVLTAREARMLDAAVRRGKPEGGVEVLSRPQLMTLDNQAAQVQISSDAGGISASVIPRVAPDGTVSLQMEARLAGASGQASDVQTIQAAESVPVGGTLVVRGMRSKTAGGLTAEVLTVVTVDLVAPDAR
jgi:hypothetical protein